MTTLVELVRSEQAAQALIDEATARKEATIKSALAQRERALANLMLPTLPPVDVPATTPDLTALTKSAERGKERAVKLILEACHAS